MFRFTIRELLLLTVIVAMGLGWRLHARRLQLDARQLQIDLLYQVDLVNTFVYALIDLGCELPKDTGPYTKILVPEYIQAHARENHKSASVSFTTSVPREQLQRTLDGEFNRFRSAQ